MVPSLRTIHVFCLLTHVAVPSYLSQAGSCHSLTRLYPTTLATLASAPHYHLQDELWKLSDCKDHWSLGLCPQTSSLDVDNTMVGVVSPEFHPRHVPRCLELSSSSRREDEWWSSFSFTMLALEPGPLRHLSWERSPVPSHPAKEAAAFGFISLTLLHPLWPATKTKDSRKGHTVKARLSSWQGWLCEEEQRQA